MNSSKSGTQLVASFALLLAVVSCCLVFVMMPWEGQRAGPPAPDPEDDRVDLTGEVVELRRLVLTIEAQLARLESEGAAAGRAGADQVGGSSGAAESAAGNSLDELLAALEVGSPELDELIAQAVARAAGASSGDAGSAAGKDKSTGKDADKGTKGIIAWIDSEVDRWAEAHSLVPAQVDALNELTRRAIAERGEAAKAGATEFELTQLDVTAQVEVRQIVGDPVYFATERERLTGELRGWVTWLPNAVGGLSDEQHAQLDGLIGSSVDGRVGDVVRLRSEPMPEQDHATLREQLERQQTQTWEAIRDQVLTDVQRARIPGK